jgi:hypothetical protein
MVAHGKPCVKCLKKFPVMHCSHIKSIGGHPNLRYDIMNVFPMCGRCHKFWWHDEPTEAGLWFIENYPGRNEYLLEAQNRVVKYTIDDLKEVRDHVKHKRVKKLIIAPDLLLDNM